jgi:uncharacterized membrane protein
MTAVRRDRLRAAMATLALLGIAIAGYLTWVHYAGIRPICISGSGGCEQVQGSRYADLAGLPVALLGLIGYVAILGSLWLRGEAGLTIGAVLTMVGLGFSAYLTYRELFTIQAICQWCVASAIVMTALAVLAVIRLVRAPELA